MQNKIFSHKQKVKLHYLDLYEGQIFNQNPICDSSFLMGMNESIKTTTILALGVMGAILSATQPFISASFATTSYLLPILWPATINTTQSFLCAAENLINEKISFFVSEQAQSRFNGLKDAVDLFNISMHHYMNTPNSTNHQYVISQFTATNTIFASSLPLFQVKGYESLLLPLFTQASNLHLLFLRDAINFFRKYQFQRKIIEPNIIYLEDRISLYTDYCTKTYHDELQKMNNPKKHADLTNKSRYPWIEWEGLIYPQPDWNEYQGIEDWNLMNDYRRTYTIAVLDFLPLWGTYSKEYTNFNNVQLSLTREVYTPARGKSTFHPQTPHKRTRAEFEKTIVRSPQLCTYLERARFHLRNYKSFPLSGVDIWRNVSGFLSNSQFNRVGFEGDTSCSITDYPVIKNEMTLNDHGYIGNLKFFSQNNELISQCGNQIENEFMFINSIPDSMKRISPYIYHHILSDIRGGIPYQNEVMNDDANGHLDYISLAWTHPSIDKYNRISSNKITQISAVRASQLLGDAIVITGPGSTGGNLVKLGTKGFIRLPITFPYTIQHYRLRIRCANKYEKGVLQVGTDSQDIIVQIPVNPDYDETLSYKSFKLIDVSTDLKITSENQYSTLYFYNLNTEIVVDKIELIPYI